MDHERRVFSISTHTFIVPADVPMDLLHVGVSVTAVYTLADLPVVELHRPGAL